MREDHRQRCVLWPDLAHRQRHTVGGGDDDAAVGVEELEILVFVGVVGADPAAQRPGHGYPRCACRPRPLRPRPPASGSDLRPRGGGVSSLLNDFGLSLGSAVGPGDPAAWAGDDLVVDGAQQVGPVLCGGFTLRARPEQDRVVTFGDVAVGSESTTNWSMQIRPTLRRSLPLISTSIRPDRLRKTPSA